MGEDGMEMVAILVVYVMVLIGLNVFVWAGRN
jgi:hypothetical protein